MRIKEGIGLFDKIDYKVLVEKKKIFREQQWDSFVQDYGDEIDDDKNKLSGVENNCR